MYYCPPISFPESRPCLWLGGTRPGIQCSRKGILKDWPSPHLKECPWYLDLPHTIQVPDDEVAISAIANVVPGGAIEPGHSAEELA